MRRRTLSVLAIVLAVLAVAPAAASVQVLPAIPKIELESPLDGLWDPLDPPSYAPLDITSPIPAAHPRLLFSASDLPAIRARAADPNSVPGRAFRQLVESADRLEVPDPIAGRLEARFGRQNLAELGLVWLLTGEEKYLTKAKAYLLAVAAAAPNYGANEVFDATEYYNTRGHVLNGLALAWDWLYPGLNDTERALLLSTITVLGTEHFIHSLTAWWGTVSTGSNFTGNNGASVGMAGLATIGDLPFADLWLARGRQLVSSYFQEGFDATGAGSEGVLYGNYGMRIPTYFGAALDGAGLPNPLLHPKIRSHPRWVAYEVLPGGGALNPLNDARYTELNPTHMLWASSHGADPDLAGWIWRNVSDRVTGGVGVAEPVAALLWHREPHDGFVPSDILALSKQFRGRGLMHVRSGWEAGDLMASFESRHNDWGEAIHQNQDVNSFTMYSHGARFVIDSGYANYLEQLLLGQDVEAARSSETEAHNYIEVDGRSQDFFGKGRLHAAVSGSWIDVAGGDARPAYMANQPKRANRWFVHLRSPDGGPGAIALADDFEQGLGPHEYRSYFQTEPGNIVETAVHDVPNEQYGTVRAPNGARMFMSVVAAHPIESAVDTFTADYEAIGTHPRLSITANAGRFQALTTLTPLGPDEWEPVASIPATNGVATRRGGDLLLMRTEDGVAHAAGLHSDAELTVVRGDDSYMIAGGSLLGSSERVLVEVHGGPATVAVSPGAIDFEGAGVTGFKAWGPRVEAVTVNGHPAAFRHCGGYVAYGPVC